MTTNENTQKQKIDLAVEKLTGFMNKDLDQARKLNLDHQTKAIEQTKLERLRKFVGHIASIDPNEIDADDNIRQRMDIESDEFANLLESITKNGVQQNLIVEFTENDSTKGYKLNCVAGHRRLAAATLAGLKTVPCLIKVFTNESEKTETALAENLLREGLHVLDIADGYQKLLTLGWKKEDIQKYFDRNQKTIRYYLKIANWPTSAKELVRNNPTQLPARLIMRKYACKKFNNDHELLSALNTELEPVEDKKPTAKRISLASKVQSYLETKRYSNETRDIIWKLLHDLQLVNEVPKKD